VRKNNKQEKASLKHRKDEERGSEEEGGHHPGVKNRGRGTPREWPFILETGKNLNERSSATGDAHRQIAPGGRRLEG